MYPVTSNHQTYEKQGADISALTRHLMLYRYRPVPCSRHYVLPTFSRIHKYRNYVPISSAHRKMLLITAKETRMLSNNTPSSESIRWYLEFETRADRDPSDRLKLSLYHIYPGSSLVSMYSLFYVHHDLYSCVFIGELSHKNGRSLASQRGSSILASLSLLCIAQHHTLHVLEILRKSALERQTTTQETRMKYFDSHIMSASGHPAITAEAGFLQGSLTVIQNDQNL